MRGRGPTAGDAGTGSGRAFLPGRELNRRFHDEAIVPILRSRFPGLRYSAALLGAGSEVFGYDTSRSMDHDWGPRAQLFVTPSDSVRLRARILRALRERLPSSFRRLSTRFGRADSNAVRVRVADGGTPLVWVGTIREFFRNHLHLDPYRRVSGPEWLLLPSQKLAALGAGPIYHDELGLARVRAKFRYYPRDVWLHLLAVQWLRIGEGEAFVGRTADVGDELGSRLLAARQVRELMRLSFLLERRFFPYDKWFGTAFRELGLAGSLRPALEHALDSRSFRAREAALSKAYGIVARAQNSLALSPSLPTRVSRFHDRPFLVIHAGEFAAAIRSKIQSPRIRELTRLGSIDQFGNTEELGSHPEQRGALLALLRA